MLGKARGLKAGLWTPITNLFPAYTTELVWEVAPTGGGL